MNTTIIDLIRHGKSVDNVNKTVSGRSLTTLSEEGVAQAKAFTSDLNYDVIFVSSLTRAKQTGEIIAEKYPNAVIQETDLIIEKYFGKIEGRKWEELEQEFPQFKDNIYEIGDHPELTEGESIETIEQRVKEFIQIIENKYKGLNILVVTHGGLMRVLYKLLTNCSEEDLENFHPKNIEIVRVEI